jgi:hypothetical protein
MGAVFSTNREEERKARIIQGFWKGEDSCLKIDFEERIVYETREQSDF